MRRIFGSRSANASSTSLGVDDELAARRSRRDETSCSQHGDRYLVESAMAAAPHMLNDGRVSFTCLIHHCAETESEVDLAEAELNKGDSPFHKVGGLLSLPVQSLAH